MAYKSLIDYYGGGMVKPSDGYQLGGLIAKSGRQRGYTSEFKNLKDLAEQSAKRREKVGGNWLRKLAVGTAGTLLGGPMGGGAALAADQALRERKFKKTDFGGGKYAQDIRGKLGKQEKAFKEKGLMRVGIAGVEGYLGGKSGGTYGKAAGGIKGGIGQIKDVAGFLGEGGTWGDVLGGYAQKIGESGAFGDTAITRGLLGAGAKAGIAPTVTKAMIAAVPDQPREKMVIPEGRMGGIDRAFESGVDASSFAGPQELQGLSPELQLGASEGFGQRTLGGRGLGTGDFALNLEQPLQQPFAGYPALAQPETPAIAMGVEEPDMLSDYDELFSEPYGQSFGEELISGQYSYPSYGSQVQQTPEWAGGFKGGGLVDYMMPQGYQGGGQVGYATATDPQQALRQMGMGDVADDPELEKHLEDLPQFGMGYKQQLGDVTAGGRAGLMDISQQARTQQAGTGFAGGGAGAVGQAQSRQKLERGVATGRRGIVESYQADLLSALADIEQKIGGDFTFGDESRPTYGTGLTGGEDYDPTATAPPGWPSMGAYDNWVQAGSDPNTASNYGWQSTGTGDTPGGYKP